MGPTFPLNYFHKLCYRLHFNLQHRRVLHRSYRAEWEAVTLSVCTVHSMFSPVCLTVCLSIWQSCEPKSEELHSFSHSFTHSFIHHNNCWFRFQPIQLFTRFTLDDYDCRWWWWCFRLGCANWIITQCLSDLIRLFFGNKKEARNYLVFSAEVLKEK